MNVNCSLVSPKKYPHLISKTQEGISLQKAIEIIETRKEDQPERNICLKKETLKAILITEGILGAMIAFMAFLIIADSKGEIVHQDRITPFKFDRNLCSRLQESDEKDGFLINHSNDYFASNFSESIPIFFLVSLLPPTLLFVIFKILDITLLHFENKKSSLLEKKKFDHILLLKETSSQDSTAPLKGKLFLSLFDLKYFKEEDLSLLNFSQVRSIKKERVSFFEKALSEQKFSPSITETFNKIEKIKKCTAEQILKTLKSNYYKKYLIEKSEILETLIRELTDVQLSKPVKKRILKLLKITIVALKYLNKKKFFTICKMMQKDHLSLKKAYEELALLSYKKMKYVTLNFGEEESNSLLVNRTLLIRESLYFEAMLCGSYEESNTELQTQGIHLKGVDLNPFQQIINFFLTGKLAITRSSLFPLLEITSQYFFLKAHKKLENYFLQFFDVFNNEFELAALLEICDDYQLNRVKNRIDFYFSLKIPDFYCSEFIPHLTFVTKYSLDENLKKIAKNLGNSLPNYSEDPQFCSSLIAAFQIAPKMVFLLEMQLIKLLEKKPTLLKEFFEEAKRINFHYLIELILKFAENPKYAHISLFNWVLSPLNSEVLVNEESFNLSDEVITLL